MLNSANTSNKRKMAAHEPRTTKLWKAFRNFRESGLQYMYLFVPYLRELTALLTT